MWVFDPRCAGQSWVAGLLLVYPTEAFYPQTEVLVLQAVKRRFCVQEETADLLQALLYNWSERCHCVGNEHSHTLTLTERLMTQTWLHSSPSHTHTPPAQMTLQIRPRSCRPEQFLVHKSTCVWENVPLRGFKCLEYVARVLSHALSGYICIHTSRTTSSYYISLMPLPSLMETLWRQKSDLCSEFSGIMCMKTREIFILYRKRKRA